MLTFGRVLPQPLAKILKIDCVSILSYYSVVKLLAVPLWYSLFIILHRTICVKQFFKYFSIFFNLFAFLSLLRWAGKLHLRQRKFTVQFRQNFGKNTQTLLRNAPYCTATLFLWQLFWNKKYYFLKILSQQKHHALERAEKFTFPPRKYLTTLYWLNFPYNV